MEWGNYPVSSNEAYIKLTSITNRDPTLPGSYRPISLVNIDARILSKLITNSLLSLLIHPAQMAFVKGRTGVKHKKSAVSFRKHQTTSHICCFCYMMMLKRLLIMLIMLGYSRQRQPSALRVNAYHFYHLCTQHPQPESALQAIYRTPSPFRKAPDKVVHCLPFS